MKNKKIAKKILSLEKQIQKNKEKNSKKEIEELFSLTEKLSFEDMIEIDNYIMSRSFKK